MKTEKTARDTHVLVVNTIISISLPNKLCKQIDDERKDISRSKFILRLLEDGYLMRGIKI